MRRNIVIGIVTAATLAVGGAATAVTVAADRDGSGSVDGGGDDRGRSASESPAAVRGDGRAAPDADTGALAKAVEAALAHTGGTAVSAEVEDDAGGADGGVWEVDVRTARGAWREVTVDADRGRVLGTRSDDPDAGEAAALRTARTGLREAAAAAARAVPGRVVSVEIDDDARSRPWEVKVLGRDGTRHEVFVDRRTAAVTEDGTGDRASGGGERTSGGGGTTDRTAADDRGRRHGGHGEDDRTAENDHDDRGDSHDDHDDHDDGSGHGGGEDD